MKYFKTYRPLVMYIGMTLGFFVVLFILVTYFLNQINVMSETRITLEQETSTLSNRLSVLNTVSRNNSNGEAYILSALPTSNNALVSIAQLRRLAAENQIIIKSMDLTSSSPSETDQVMPGLLINLDILGDPIRMISFIDGISHVAPLMSLDNLSIKSQQKGVLLEAIIAIRSQWSPLPTILPAITESISGLDERELALLNEISQLLQPEFGVTVEASGSGIVGKSNPFSSSQ